MGASWVLPSVTSSTGNSVCRDEEEKRRRDDMEKRRKRKRGGGEEGRRRRDEKKIQKASIETPKPPLLYHSAVHTV